MKHVKRTVNAYIYSLQKCLYLFCLIFLLCGKSFTAIASLPFYFVAKHAPQGSITQPGMDSYAVYLRWDLFEGELPSDITGFNLYRDGVLIGQFPANQILDGTAINALYQPSAQRRRLLETVSLLKEESVLDPNVPTFAVNEYGDTIAQRLQSDNYWAVLASRRDFNIAIARNRAIIDNPGLGIFSYELKALNVSMEMQRVGLVSVDTRQLQNLLPTPGFKQLVLSQCDEPDIKDHYSVALNWQAVGGINMADRMANQLFVSGYDIYRTTQNIASSVLTAPLRDLASEAAKLGFNATGGAAFSDLERVNSTLITVSPDLDVTNPEWLETQADLANAGLKPGDRRVYYLVARDFTGNFGPSIGTIVMVKDMSRPPPPWDIDVYLSQENQQVELSFEEIGQQSYLESFGATKRVCAVSVNGVLSFVGREESCATQYHKMVQTKVKGYLLYRFDNFADASSFKDSDGDGYKDSAERPSNKQCETATQVGGALVRSSFVTQTLDDHVRVRIADQEPAQQKGRIYWYRLASVGLNDRLSFLSEPVRVNFPERALPQPPLVTANYPGDGSTACGCEVNYEATNNAWSFRSDESLGTNLNFACNGKNYMVSPKAILGPKSASCNLLSPTSGLARDCQFGGQITAANDDFVCSAGIPASADFCKTGAMTLDKIACESAPAPLGVIKGPLTITVAPEAADQCVSIYQQIAGEVIKVSSSCGEASQIDTYVIEKGEFCGHAVSHDSNNNISASTQIGCREVLAINTQDLLIVPRIDALELGSDFANVNIALPTQKQSIVEIEILRKKPSEGDKQIKRSGIASATAEAKTINFDIPALSGPNDQWCVKARIHAPSAIVGEPRISEWTASLCKIRASSSLTEPKWLSWPGLETANQSDDLIVKFNSDFVVLHPSSTILNGLHIPVATSRANCTATPSTITLFGDSFIYASQDFQVRQEIGPALVNILCRENAKYEVEGNYLPKLNFIVFRQQRKNGVTSDFKQVSPIIDYTHWIKQTTDKSSVYRLKDPYIWASIDNIKETQPMFIHLSFVDRAPLVPDQEYRYQFVYFNRDHKLTTWRQTQWIFLTQTPAQ